MEPCREVPSEFTPDYRTPLARPDFSSTTVTPPILLGVEAADAGVPCGDHGYFIVHAVELEEPSHYVWETHARDGALIQRGAGPIPYVIGNLREDRYAAPELPPYRKRPSRRRTDSDTFFVPGKGYTLTARVVSEQGHESAPARISFVFEKTGRGGINPYMALGFLSLLAAAVAKLCVKLSDLLPGRPRDAS